MTDRRWNGVQARGRLVAGALGTVLLLCGAEGDAAGPVALKKVPAAVMAAANKIAPGVRWTDAYEDVEDGQIVYELEGEGAMERDVSVDVTAAGKVTLVESEMELSDVPAAVTAAVIGRIPTFTAVAAYAIRRGSDLAGGEAGEKAFALDGTDDKDREVSFETTAEGKIVSLDREIGVGEVPVVVMTALAAKVPQFKAAAAHEIHDRDSLTGYVLEGTRPAKLKGKKGQAKGGEEINVFVSADGTEVEVDAG